MEFTFTNFIQQKETHISSYIYDIFEPAKIVSGQTSTHRDTMNAQNKI